MAHGLFLHTLSFSQPKKRSLEMSGLPGSCFILQYETRDFFSFIFALFGHLLISLHLVLFIWHIFLKSFPRLTKGTLVQICIIYHLGFLCNHRTSGVLPATHNCISTIHLFPLAKSYINILLHYTASCLSYLLYQIPILLLLLLCSLGFLWLYYKICWS